MVNKRILLARDGQTEWNREGRQQGRLDSPLTELGRSQARAVAELLRDFSVDGILVSPMGRARATAAIISEALGVPVAVCEDLAELYLGGDERSDPWGA
ncbi:histidine phosphatase family protein [Nesterenkonia ebinurensis]|uniref:histidine phosphatase family protein n=1 Tax=Nesterenkonia ebinurensis TaxID=2608252 RepID=UPI00123D0CDD